MKFNIIGAGRLGACLAVALKTVKNSTVSIVSKNIENAQKVAALSGGKVVTKIEELLPADVTFIATPDDAIKSVVMELGENNFFNGSIVAHCSGLHSSLVLYKLHQYGCSVASIHPFRSFAKITPSENSFANCYCSLEGDVDAVGVIDDLFSSLRAKVICIKPDKKCVYHSAATIAANYLVTIADCSESLLLESGVPADHAKDMLLSLMQSTLDNIAAVEDIKKALTGPIARADIDTISAHLGSIKNEEINLLYRVAGITTLKLTNHDHEKLQKLKSILGLDSNSL